MARYSISETDVVTALSAFNIPPRKLNDVIMSLDVDAIEANTERAGGYAEMRIAAHKAIQEQFVLKLFPLDIANSIIHDLRTRLGDKTAKSVLKSALPRIDNVLRENETANPFNLRKTSTEAKIALFIHVSGFENAIAMLATFFGINFQKINLWYE